MLSTDQTLTCGDCGTTFPFSASEQAFYQERGFTTPKRCKACRAAAKSRMGGGTAGGSGTPAPRGERTERTMYPTTCAQCGVSTEVPFKPTGTRPVLCRDCFRQH
ncbi:MAG: zinc-ribbon domain containing protein [Candidatus Sericytochromatia bacterium]|nr:zinc-ribbon domain containing protein [Candidatus Sericytochromatia bacterium]